MDLEPDQDQDPYKYLRIRIRIQEAQKLTDPNPDHRFRAKVGIVFECFSLLGTVRRLACHCICCEYLTFFY
jgi:hypothetical protein